MAGKSLNVIISPPYPAKELGQTDPETAPPMGSNTGMKGETNVQERQEGR